MKHAQANIDTLARMRIGELLQLAIDLESSDWNDRYPVSAAAALQRELCIIAHVRRGLLVGDSPAISIVRPEMQSALMRLSGKELASSPVNIVDTFRSRILIDPELDLGSDYGGAEALQLENAIPSDVPPLGRLIDKIPGKLPGFVGPSAVNAVLLAQACFRSMLSEGERQERYMMRSLAGDPDVLREGQSFANKILCSDAPLSMRQGLALERISVHASEALRGEGLPSLAHYVREYVECFVWDLARPADCTNVIRMEKARLD